MVMFDLQKTVLVVDDLPSTRLLISDMLREMGFTDIMEAASGDEAVELLSRNRPSLIVCDCVMRGMSGLEVIKEVRRNPETRRVPAIMLSNNRDVPFIDAAIRAGADDYIVKPISFHILKRRILDVLGRTPESLEV